MSDWSPQQEQALAAVSRWFKTKSSDFFYLGGFAGTGKTTLAKHFAEGAGNTAFAALTGKAASVLRKKGCPGATTIHSLIYRPAGKTHGKRIEELEDLIEKTAEAPPPEYQDWTAELTKLKAKSRANFELQDEPAIVDCDLVIIDECSMIDAYMARDLLSFGVPILFLGDPGQLPPVGGASYLNDREPHFMLTDIHRQAKDSAIIWAATEIRNGRKIGFGNFGEGQVRLAPKADFDLEELLKADQVLCGKNATRHSLNQRLRKARGFGLMYPTAGEKLICLKNNRENGLLNGVTCTTKQDSVKRGITLGLHLDYDGAEKVLIADPGPFEENYGARRSHPRYEAVDIFDYGYAITTHKSQGSQWPSVAICDDRMWEQDVNMRRRWLYTAFTRAEENLLVYA
jgi:exodeoxyribonuclease-5